jgi:uncharacterized membrane protein
MKAMSKFSSKPPFSVRAARFCRLVTIVMLVSMVISFLIFASTILTGFFEIADVAGLATFITMAMALLFLLLEVVVFDPIN